MASSWSETGTKKSKYDPVKAHEYYVNYRKKGLKKGRKKGKTKEKTVSLVGVTTKGLNDEGKIQAALIKEKLKAQMNEALKEATSEKEKEQIRIRYSRQAQQEMARLRSDPTTAAPKTEKKTKEKTEKQAKQTKQTKQPKSENTSGDSGGSSGGDSGGGTPTPAPTTPAKQPKTPAKKPEEFESTIIPVDEEPISTIMPVEPDKVELLTNLFDELNKKIDKLPEDKKKEVEELLKDILEELTKLRQPKGYTPVTKDQNGKDGGIPELTNGRITDGSEISKRRKILQNV